MSSEIAKPLQYKDWSNFVALPHSVFALPFALSAYLLAWKAGPLVLSSFGELSRLVIVVIAVVTARTAAMSFNRLLDAEIDSSNPRTCHREIPSGRISKPQGWLLVFASVLVFLICCGLLGRHCLMLSPLVLLVLFGYSATKRFTSHSHLVLGLALAFAPGGAWWVLRPQIEPVPILLMVGVLLWVAGFDILYSCQDVLFDRRTGLHSIPSTFGIERALHLSTSFHALSLFSFFAVGQILSLGSQYLLGLIVFGLILLGQHRLMTPHDLRRINQAFFLANGFLSLFYFALIVALVFLR